MRQLTKQEWRMLGLISDGWDAYVFNGEEYVNKVEWWIGTERAHRHGTSDAKCYVLKYRGPVTEDSVAEYDALEDAEVLLTKIRLLSQ